MVKLDGKNMTISDIIRIIDGEKVQLTPGAIKAVKKSRKYIEDTLKNKDKTIYGINTGFGDLAGTRIKNSEIELLQENLILSHACGTGPLLDISETRGSMALRINTLARGVSGVKIETLNLMCDMLNHGIHPEIPSQGSVGASGDLAPLAHMACALIGVGKVEYKGKTIESAEALKKAGLKKLTLGAKEGLCLINGTQVMTAILAIVLNDAFKLVTLANLSAAMSLESLLGTIISCDKRLHEARPHSGQSICASEIRKAVEGSNILTSHEHCEEVQDAYSLRCTPQVHGAVLDTLEHAKKVLEIEINSATDNPLVFADSDAIISGGNFHGEPIAMIGDFTGIAIAELGSISERRIDRLVNPHTNKLEPFLVKNSGVNSGLMIPQYVAASLVSENKVLSHPACVDSIPTSGGKEDHVSMGTIAARKAKQILTNVKTVICIELFASSQAQDLRKPLKPGKLTEWMKKEIRKVSPFIEKDRFFYTDLNAIKSHVMNDKFLTKTVNKFK